MTRPTHFAARLPFFSLVCLSLAAGCSETPPAGSPADLDGAKSDYESGYEMEASAAAIAEDVEFAPVVGTVEATVDDTTYSLTVTRCDFRSIIGAETAIGSFAIEAHAIADPTTSEDPPWAIRFQLQELPEQDGGTNVALLDFNNDDRAVMMMDSPDDESRGSYQLLVDGAAYDLRSGSNGTLEPQFDALLEPPTVAVELAFTDNIQLATENPAQPLAAATMNLDLAAACAIRWSQ